MVDTNKLYKMIRVMGKMDLKSLIRRFPGESVESLRAIVEDTEGLEIVGSFVKVKEKTAGLGTKEDTQATDRQMKDDKRPTIELTATDSLKTSEGSFKEEKQGRELEERVRETSNASGGIEIAKISEEREDEKIEVAELREEELNEEIKQEDEEIIESEEVIEDVQSEELDIIKNLTANGESCYESSQSNYESKTPKKSASAKAYSELRNLISPVAKTSKVELRDVSKKQATREEDIVGFEKLIDLINQYNEKIEEELKELMSDTEKRKKDAIYKYLDERYTIEPYKKYDTTTILSQLDKSTNNMRGYAVITKDFTEDLFDLIDSLFEDDMVFIYYTNENCVEILDTTKEFFLRPTETIVDQYMEDFEIKKIPVELSEIVKVDDN